MTIFSANFPPHSHTILAINCVHASNWFTHLTRQIDGQNDNSVLTVYNLMRNTTQLLRMRVQSCMQLQFHEGTKSQYRHLAKLLNQLANVCRMSISLSSGSDLDNSQQEPFMKLQLQTRLHSYSQYGCIVFCIAGYTFFKKPLTITNQTSSNSVIYADIQ